MLFLVVYAHFANVCVLFFSQGLFLEPETYNAVMRTIQKDCRVSYCYMHNNQGLSKGYQP